MRLSLSRSHTQFVCPEDELAGLRKEFDECHSLMLHGFLDAEVLALIHRRMRDARAEEIAHEVGHEMEVREPGTNALLGLISNDDALFRAIDALTGCGPIASFSGRIYQMHGGGDHEFHWHTDVEDDRIIAMSVNLGTDPFAGGELQIAELPSRRIVRTLANTGVGDAVIFRIAPTLMHRVNPVTGSIPKMAYAGWFRARTA